ncbi:MAG TPA: LysR family transcriptional regulator [Caulobacteraceae bacterium]|nr:LysR family transcriptional regulator [Caulobacteraceae bacterium]
MATHNGGLKLDGDGADQLLLHLDDLKAVSAIVVNGGMTAAAQALGKSGSALKRAVAEVEQALGLTLLERRRGAVSATAAGQALLARFERIEAEISGALADLNPSRGASSAALRRLLYSGRKLRLLIHLADEGTVSGAAGMLGVTQSGASMALSRIEETIGVALFHRRVHGVFPTDAAACLVLRAQRIRAELRHALSDITSLAGHPSGTTVIGTLPMARAAILPRAIGNCLDAWPHVRVQVVEAQREALLAQLRSGQIDAVLAARSAHFDPRGLISEPVFSDRLAVFAAPGHPLAGKARVSLRELASAKWILPLTNAVSRSLFDQQFRKRGLRPPTPLVQTGDLLIIRPLLARGDMLAFTSLSLVQTELDAGMVARIDVEMDELGRNIVLLQREAAHLPASAHRLMQAIRTVAAAP